MPGNKVFSIEVDSINSDSYAAPPRRGSPERNLLMAILERAILDYVGNDKKEIEHSKTWIFDDAEEELATEFSFPWLCQQLDIDRKSVAATIKAMPKRGTRRVAPWYFAKEEMQKAS